MQSIWKRATALTLSASLVGACATSPEKIQTAYVSPLAYQNYSCTDIRAELGRVTLRAQELQGNLQEKADNDTGKMVIGMVLFWPILFALEGDDPSAQEYARLKGEREALEQLATRKNCRGITIVDVNSQEPGKQASVRPAEPAPVQPAAAAQPPAQQSAAAPVARSKEERLRELKALKAKGLIADEVYDEEQHRILAEPTPAAKPATSSVAMAAPAAAPAPAATGPGGLRPGDRWEYTVVDSRKGSPARRSFEIAQTSDLAVFERIRLEDGKTVTAEHRKGPYLIMLGGMQFSPYYLALQPVAMQGPVGSVRVLGGDACATREEGTGDYGVSHDCEIRAEIAETDRVTVPAGTYLAIRVRVTIDSQAKGGLNVRRHVGDGDFWISAKAGRLIKATVKYDASRPWTETMELESTNVALTQ